MSAPYQLDEGQLPTHRLAVCHLLLVASVLALRAGNCRLAGVLWLCVGAGGLGASWGHYSARAGRWLDLSALGLRPERRELVIAAGHTPALVAGAFVLLRRVRR